MLYVMLLSHWEAPAEMAPAERDQAVADVMRWWGQNQASGVIVDGLQLQAPATATTVVIANGTSTLIDGPYLASKEGIGGYGVLEVPDLDVALEVARTWPLPGSRIELRPVDAM